MKGTGRIDTAIVGGCGHVGLPLGIALAEAGQNVRLYDIDTSVVEMINNGSMPFLERGADDLLRTVIGRGTLEATSDPTVLTGADHVVIVIGTPVDEHLNPDPMAVSDAIKELLPYFRDGQLIVLRSTVFPGVTRMIETLFESSGLNVDVAFCPERIAEGRALTELHELPQIVASRTESGHDRASALFETLTETIVSLMLSATTTGTAACARTLWCSP